MEKLKIEIEITPTDWSSHYLNIIDESKIHIAHRVIIKLSYYNNGKEKTKLLKYLTLRFLSLYEAELKCSPQSFYKKCTVEMKRIVNSDIEFKQLKRILFHKKDLLFGLRHDNPTVELFSNRISRIKKFDEVEKQFEITYNHNNNYKEIYVDILDNGFIKQKKKP